VPVLIEGLKDEDHNIRLFAAEVLCEIGPPAKAAIPALEERSKDLSQPVCDAVSRALAKIRN
jgi:HEAT repeat protein